MQPFALCLWDPESLSTQEACGMLSGAGQKGWYVGRITVKGLLSSFLSGLGNCDSVTPVFKIEKV